MKSEPEKFSPASQVLRCLDELEHLVESSNSLPLTHHKIVDEEAFFIATQRLKMLLPAAAVASEATSERKATAPARLHKGSTLLLIVDVQERLMPAVHNADEVEKNCLLLARAAAHLQIPVLMTEQYPEKLGRTLSSIREAAALATPVAKMRFSACEGSTRDAIKTSGRDTILLCGVEGHVCILQTALDLLEEGFSVFASRDAISSRTPENAQVGWERMMREGVLPTSAESAVFELLADAGTPDFKALLPFLK